MRTITGHLQDHANRHAVLGTCDATTAGAASAAICDLAKKITSEGAGMASMLISTATLGDGRLKLELDRAALAQAATLRSEDLHPSLSCIDAPFACKRRGVETRILAGDRMADPDATLIRALRNAHCWSEALKSGIPLRQLALSEGHSERYMARVITMISLSPKIQAEILNGTQRVEMNLERLMRGPIPLSWGDQDTHYGSGKKTLPCSAQILP